ncbi:hypothetical protein Tco_0988762 [Tanacetum coccineum]|uniref:Uncharacterized protein n=1 Tax=Tanacetum coccineum TaxID=301880 RepID=A0ABQ5ESC1_9ASTR
METSIAIVVSAVLWDRSIGTDISPPGISGHKLTMFETLWRHSVPADVYSSTVGEASLFMVRLWDSLMEDPRPCDSKAKKGMDQGVEFKHKIYGATLLVVYFGFPSMGLKDYGQDCLNSFVLEDSNGGVSDVFSSFPGGLDVDETMQDIKSNVVVRVPYAEG